jgi:hypothetical protein
MKRKILLLLVVLNIGCNSQNDKKGISVDILPANSFYTINIPEILKNQREVPVSEIAEKIEYVVLETSKESLLGRILDMKVTKDFIFIQHHNGALAQFDRTGSFIRYIGRLGRGPEEYIMIREFSIDEKNRRIYIQSNYNRIIQIYSFDGEQTGSFNFNEDYGFIVWSRDSLFMCFREPTRGTEEFVFTERNSKGEILQYVRNNFFWQNDNAMSYVLMNSDINVYYRLNNRLHFKGWYNDTIYTYDGNNKFVPKFFIDLGKFKLPDELRFEKKGEIESSAGYYWIGVKEALRYVFIMYGNYYEGENSDQGSICYDKNEGAGNSLINKNGGNEFVNDLDGGPDFWPEYVNDSLAFQFIQAKDMKEYLNSDDFIKSTSRFPEKKEMLINQMTGLKESDNDVLMVVKLK